jgi:hypothetical protein
MDEVGDFGESTGYSSVLTSAELAEGPIPPHLSQKRADRNAALGEKKPGGREMTERRSCQRCRDWQRMSINKVNIRRSR